MSEDIQLLTMAEYAKHKGVAAPTVTYAVKSGKLSKSITKTVTGKTMINPIIADQEWIARAPNASQDPGENPKYDILKDKRYAPIDLDGEIPMLAASRAKREAFEAELARIKFEKETGKLIEADKVEKDWVTRAVIMRNKVLSIPSKFRQRFPDISDDMYQTLDDIIRLELETMADENIVDDIE